ncbi:hypothetical protein BG006_004579 [Podila minutissima]|uniref:Uncharacterized protein n=1 Tax=Podila minutissima TaxID=64525 RepID=A0A9P5VG04_9FUNG|nr:hypothetical protein BG006_004579 [Podila minutissima]
MNNTNATMAAPVIPSHRYAMQILAQQQQQQLLQQQGHHMPMTMTGLTMEAQSKMNQDLQMGTLGSMAPMASTTTADDMNGYDPTRFWVDFSAAESNPGPPATTATTVADGQYNGSLWM